MTATKTSTKKTTAKQPGKTKPAAEASEQKMSALEAAARVLKEKGVAMTCPELIGVMAAKAYWSSPGGKTPAATLSSAIIREITTKGNDSRFTKTAPGRFVHKDSPIVGLTTATPAKKGKATKAATEPTRAAEATETTPTPTA